MNGGKIMDNERKDLEPDTDKIDKVSEEVVEKNESSETKETRGVNTENINMEAPKKKNMLIVIASIVILALIGVGVAAGAGLFSGKKRGKRKRPGEWDRIHNGIQNMMKPSEHSIEEKVLGIRAVSEAMKKNSAGVNLAVTVDEAGGQKVGNMIGFDIDIKSDSKSLKNFLGLDFNVLGKNMEIIRAYTDKKEILFSLPKFLSKAVKLDMTGDLKEKVEKAPIFKNLDKEKKEEVVKSLQDYQKMTAGSFSNNEKIDEVEKIIEENTVLKKEGEPELEVFGKTKKVDMLRLSISKENAVKLMEEFSKISKNVSVSSKTPYGVQNQKDLSEVFAKAAEKIKKNDNFKTVEIDFYFDGDEILKISSEGDGYSFNLQRNEGERLGDDLKFNAVIGKGFNKATFDFSKKTKYDGEDKSKVTNLFTFETAKDRFIVQTDTNTDASNKSRLKSDTSVSLSDNKGTSFKFDIKGEYLNITKNKGYDYNMKVSLTQILGGRTTVIAKLNGKLSMQSGVKVERPQIPEEIDIFTATEEDMKKLTEEIQKNIQSVVKTFMPGLGVPGRN